MKKAAAAVGVALALIAGYAVGHGGGLDRFGCHTDSRTGGYHCH